jgi:hypothetical protein
MCRAAGQVAANRGSFGRNRKKNQKKSVFGCTYLHIYSYVVIRHQAKGKAMQVKLFVVGAPPSSGKHFEVIPDRCRIEAKSEDLAGSPELFLELGGEAKEFGSGTMVRRQFTLRLYAGDIQDILEAAAGAGIVFTPHHERIREAIGLLQQALPSTSRSSE